MASELMALEPLCKYARNFPKVMIRLPASASWNRYRRYGVAIFHHAHTVR